MSPEPLENPLRSALFTDLYELTMAQAYHAEGMNAHAAFEMFYRKLPQTRNYIISAGLQDVLEFLENLHFTGDDIDWLRQRKENFSGQFLQRLRELRFTGDVRAMPEGTLAFPGEPIVQVVAPVIEAQLVETLVVNQVQFQSLATTKAARIVTAARGRTVVDFGSRRAHGVDAAMKVARSCRLAGADGTSNVLAGKLYGVPIFGTMAHSYVQAHDSETDAMEAFARLYGDTTLVVDTYDTIAGVKKVIDLAAKMGRDFTARAVRLDSGDLGELARKARAMLDEAGLTEVRIFASSGLDEYEIERLLDQGAPIDGFGVGTALAVSPDACSLDCAYKLVEYADRPRMKLSAGKDLYPGRKQVFRLIEDGQMANDTIALHHEMLPGEPLLVQVMKAGRRTIEGQATLDDARRRLRMELERLPRGLRELAQAKSPFPVRISKSLQSLHDAVAESLCRASASSRHFG